MNTKPWAMLLVTSLALITNSAFAGNYISCDNCIYSQQANAAIAHGVGFYVVGDVIGNNANAFRVYLASAPNRIGQPVSNTVPQKLYYDNEALTAQDAAAFSKLVAFYNAAPVGYQKQYNLQIVAAGTSSTSPLTVSSAALAFTPSPEVTAPGSAAVQYPIPGVNAYNVLNGGPQQNQFLYWAGSQTAFQINSTISNLVGTTPLTLIGGSAWKVGITVYFTDNSHIGVYVDMSQIPAQLKVNPTSAMDSHGNNIPASQQAVAGTGRETYSFAGLGNVTDQPNMSAQIGAFGISVPEAKGGGYACTSVSGVTNCIKIQ